jgi:FtsP/CotA-like multicopper oxidase with cupredoxin domain
MDKIHPEVKGLTQRIFVIRQQYLVPWVPGPYQLSINFQVAAFPTFPAPVIEMKPKEKQFWRVANATIQDFMPLQVLFNGKPQKLQVVALDGYPVKNLRYQDTILVPPAEGVEATFVTNAYSTGITGNPDLGQVLGDIRVSKDAEEPEASSEPDPSQPMSLDTIKFAGLSEQKPTKQRKLFFSEKFGGTGGPIQFFITLDGHKPKVFEANEKPVITTHVGAVEDWTIENRALESHAFHIHQIHFQVLEVDGKPVAHEDMRDTIQIPYWDGKGPYHSVKLRMDFRDPVIAGTFVFHCHILLHEDLGMMHKILVKP